MFSVWEGSGSRGRCPPTAGWQSNINRRSSALVCSKDTLPCSTTGPPHVVVWRFMLMACAHAHAQAHANTYVLSSVNFWSKKCVKSDARVWLSEHALLHRSVNWSLTPRHVSLARPRASRAEEKPMARN